MEAMAAIDLDSVIFPRLILELTLHDLCVFLLISSSCVNFLFVFFPPGATKRLSWSITLTCCMNTMTSRTLDSRFWAESVGYMANSIGRSSSDHISLFSLQFFSQMITNHECGAYGCFTS